MSEQPRRRRRAAEELENTNLPEEKVSEVVQTHQENRMPQLQSRPAAFCPKCAAKMPEKAVFCSRCGYIMKKSRRNRKNLNRILSALVIFVLVAVLLAVALLAMGGPQENAIKRAVWKLNPTTAPTPQITATPVVEYVYITPEPTIAATPVVEYVYITPEPTPKPTELEMGKRYTLTKKNGVYRRIDFY